MEKNQAVKIIVTCFEKRKLRKDQKFPDHNQSYIKTSDTFKLIETIVQKEKEVSPGRNMDTVIVVNGGTEEQKSFISQFNGQETKTGEIIIVFKENNGYSFGGYNYAFELFKDKYLYWMFTEDDIIFDEENYFKILQDQFTDNVGFVAAIGIGKASRGRIHAHGGVGYTDINVLQQVYDKNGRLPCPDFTNANPNKLHWLAIDQGEIPFTYAIYQLNYELKVSKQRVFTFYEQYYKKNE
jgi:hypothetical protein